MRYVVDDGPRKPARESCGAPRIEVCLARYLQIERLKRTSRSKQQGRSVTASVLGIRRLGTQKIHPDSLELIKSSTLGGRHEPQSRIEHARLKARLSRG